MNLAKRSRIISIEPSISRVGTPLAALVVAVILGFAFEVRKKRLKSGIPG